MHLGFPPDVEQHGDKGHASWGEKGWGILHSLHQPSHPNTDVVMGAWRKWRLVYNPDPVLKLGGTSCSIAKVSYGLWLHPSRAQVEVLNSQGCEVSFHFTYEDTNAQRGQMIKNKNHTVTYLQSRTRMHVSNATCVQYFYLGSSQFAWQC